MTTISRGVRVAKFARRIPAASHHVFHAIQPWYDWGRTNVFRLDAITEAETTEGLVRFLEVQWFGIHLGILFGRTPAKSVSRGAA